MIWLMLSRSTIKDIKREDYSEAKVAHLYISEENKCDDCGRKKLDIMTYSRVNNPFGKKSIPRLTPKKVVEVCRNVKTDKSGKVTWSCGYVHKHII